MHRALSIAFLALGVVAGGTAGAQAGSPVGRWVVADKSAQIEIRACGGAFCGTVAHSKLGTPVGTAILRDMRPVREDRWSGTVLDPRSGKIYTSTMSLKGPGKLRVRGCLMGFCGGETWRKI